MYNAKDSSSGYFQQLLIKIERLLAREYKCTKCNANIPGECMDFYISEACEIVPLTCDCCVGTGWYQKKEEFRKIQIEVANVREAVWEIKYAMRNTGILDDYSRKQLFICRERMIRAMKEAIKILKHHKDACLASRFQ